jgi:hypothetical protein
MATLIAKNRTALAGMAIIFLCAAILAVTLAVANPAFVSYFSANASEVVTGQTSAVSVIIASSETSVGVFADKE